jgi:hypothetical protein
MAIRLKCASSIPVNLAKKLRELESVLVECNSLEAVQENDNLYQIAKDLHALCLKEGVIGYHYTRALREEIETHGLIVSSGQDRRRDFLAQHGHRFSKVQRKRILQMWETYFIPSQPQSRDGKIWFNFTLSALENGGADDLLTYYGGEIINMPLTQDEEIATVLRTIGEPLIVECALETQSLYPFCRSEIPWGEIWLSSYQVTINPDAQQFDIDAYQEQPVPPSHVVSIYVPSSK